MPAAGPDGLPIVLFDGPEEFEAWIEEEGAVAGGAWLQLAKKAAVKPSISYGEAVEVGLCHGWIDSQKRRLDDEYSLQRFTPRRPRGRWSKINRGKVEALIEAGRMRAAGLAEVEAAKADGRWEAAYASPGQAEVPADLRRRLDADPRAAKAFAELDGANRYAILYRLEEAKREETRARRLDKFVAMLERGEKIHE